MAHGTREEERSRAGGDLSDELDFLLRGWGAGSERYEGLIRVTVDFREGLVCRSQKAMGKYAQTQKQKNGAEKE